MIGQIILQIVLIAMNAIFACAEIAVISSNETRIAKMAEQGNKKAKRLQNMQTSPAQFLATIQVAITLSGFLGSAFAADHFSEALVSLLLSWGVPIPAATLQTISVILITILLSFFTLVFGELVPKRIAMRKAESVALGISTMIHVISKLFSPLVWLLTASTNGVLRLLHIDPNEEAEDVSEEDIRMMADAGSEKGIIAAEENEMIQNVFEFNDWTAEEIMTHRTELQMLWERDSLAVWKQTIRNTPHRYYPVCGESPDDIIGILDTRKLFAVEEQTKECLLQTAVAPAFFIPSTAKANAIFRMMREAGQSYAIVLDEFGGTDGVLTMLDLVERLVGSLDEAADATELQEENGVYRIAGTCELERLEESLHIQLNDTEATTAGGWVVEQLGRIPDAGETLLANGYQFIVEKADPRKVLLLSATVQPETVTA